MAEKVIPSEFEEAGLNPFNAPIPGESLTAAPENPKAWERPPEYTDEEEAMEAVYFVLTDETKLGELIKLIGKGIPLDEIAQVVLYRGYTEGKFNPDLLLLLIEPTIYLLIAIADYAAIKDYVLYKGEDDDVDTEIPDDNIVPIDMDGDGIPDEVKPKKEIREPKEDSVSKSLLAKIKTELPSKIKQVSEEEQI